MAWRCGSLSRSLLSTPRASTLGSCPSLPHLSPPPSLLHSQGSPSRRLLSSALPRTTGVLVALSRCCLFTAWWPPTRLTSHITVEARACCELSQGT